MNMSLEKQFATYKMLHIVAVLKVMLIKYYEVVLSNYAQLPSFMGGDTPEKCADKEIENLYNTDLNKFMEMYERAYVILANEGEI